MLSSLKAYRMGRLTGNRLLGTGCASEFVTSLKFANAILALLKFGHFFICETAKDLLLQSLGLLLDQTHHFAKSGARHNAPHSLYKIRVPTQAGSGDTLHAVKEGNLRWWPTLCGGAVHALIRSWSGYRVDETL